MNNKKLITFLAIILFLFTTSKVTYAQSDLALRYKIESSLYSYYNKFGREIYSSLEHKNKAYTFGFAIFVNNFGTVDSVSFTNKTKDLDSLVSFDQITVHLKKEKTAFIKYKNTIIVSVALVRRGWDNIIDNFYEKSQLEMNSRKLDFDQNFLNMLPNIEGFEGKRNIKIFQSFSLIQGKSQR